MILLLQLFVTSVLSSCSIKNSNVKRQVVVQSEPFYMPLSTYFDGEGLSYQTNATGSIIPSLTQVQSSTQNFINATDVSSLLFYSNEFIATQYVAISGVNVTNSSGWLALGLILPDGSLTSQLTQFSYSTNDLYCPKQVYLNTDFVLFSCQSYNTSSTASYLYYLLFDTQTSTIYPYNTSIVITNYSYMSFDTFYENGLYYIQQVYVFNNPGSIKGTVVSLNVTAKTYKVVDAHSLLGTYIGAQMGRDGAVFFLNETVLGIWTNYGIEYVYNLNSNDSFVSATIQNNLNNTNIYGVAIMSESHVYYFTYTVGTKLFLNTASQSMRVGQIPSSFNTTSTISSIYLKNKKLVCNRDNGLLYYNIDVVKNIELIGYIASYQASTVNWNSNLIYSLYNSTFNVIQFTTPQLYLTATETLNLNNTYIVGIDATGPQQDVNCSIVFELYVVNKTNMMNPIQISEQPQKSNYSYPDVIYMESPFVGPALSVSFQNQSQVKNIQYFTYGDVSSKSSNALYVGICNVYDFQFNVVQESSMSVTLFLEKGTQNSTQTLPFTSQLFDISCEQTTTSVTLALGFADSVYVIQYDYQLQPLTNQSIVIPAGERLVSFQVQLNLVTLITNSSQIYAFDIELFQQVQSSVLGSITTPRGIYKNDLDYYGMLFIDNTTNLVILQYVQTGGFYQFNSLTYPVTGSTYASIGLLKDGVYAAFVVVTAPTTTSNFLYFYPKEMIKPVQLVNESPFQVLLNNFGFKTPIVSISSHNYFYIITDNNKLAVFQNKNGPDNSLAYLSQSLTISKYSSMSIRSLVNLDFLYISTPSSIAYSVEMYFKQFALFQTPFSSEASSSFGIELSATNPWTSQSVNATTTLTINNPTIAIQASTITNYSLNSFTSGSLTVDPTNLFTGSIQNYTVSCSECSSISVAQPISGQIQPIVNASNYYLMAQQADSYNIFIQTNSSVLLLQYDSTQTTVLYQIQSGFSCSNIFVEYQTQYPVSICWNSTNSIIYSYNMDNSSAITPVTVNVPIYQAYYMNGVLQTMSGTIYTSWYFAIIGGEIVLQQINQVTDDLFVYSYNSPLNISLPQSLTTTSDVCYLFGLMFLTPGEEKVKILMNYQCTPSNLFNTSSSYTATSTSVNNGTYYLDLSTYIPMDQILQLGYATQTTSGDEYEITVVAQTGIYPTVLTFNLLNNSISEVQQKCKYYQINIQNGIYNLLLSGDKFISYNPLYVEVIQYPDISTNSQYCTSSADFVPFIYVYSYSPSTSSQWQNIVLTQDYLLMDYNGILYINHISNNLVLSASLSQSATATLTAQNAGGQTATQTLSLPYSGSTSSSDLGWIIGGSILGLLIIVGIIVYCVKKNQQKDQEWVVKGGEAIEIKSRLNQ